MNIIGPEEIVPTLEVIEFHKAVNAHQKHVEIFVIFAFEICAAVFAAEVRFDTHVNLHARLLRRLFDVANERWAFFYA